MLDMLDPGRRILDPAGAGMPVWVRAKRSMGVHTYSFVHLHPIIHVPGSICAGSAADLHQNSGCRQRICTRTWPDLQMHLKIEKCQLLWYNIAKLF